jgi:hypothetical protein
MAMLCHSAGAEVTAMVHRRVFCLIVTDAAARQNTQKIRKARKYGVPIVPIEWLTDCLAQRQVVPFQRLVEFPSGTSTNTNSSSTRNNNNNNFVVNNTQRAEQVLRPPNHPAIAESQKIVDLGCCCACHELGTADICPWCVSCSLAAITAR